MDIGKETIQQTVKCNKDFRCLKDNCESCCKVLSCVDGKVHFVEYNSKSYCGYRMIFGNSYICNCPTRKEIYNKYGV